MLAIVATNSSAFVRHEGDVVSGGLEGIAESGGEPFESGVESGIERSQVGVHAERAAGKRVAVLYLEHDPFDASETAPRQRRAQARGVQRVRFDPYAASAARLRERLLRQRGDDLVARFDRVTDQALGEQARHGDGAIEVARGAVLLGVAQGEPS